VANGKPRLWPGIWLEKSLNLSVRLWPTDLAQCVENAVVVEIPLKLVVKTWSLVLVRVDELRPVVGDHLQNLTL